MTQHNTNIRTFTAAAYNTNFNDFCETLGLDADNYARDKFSTFKRIGQLLEAFSDSSLEALTVAYQTKLERQEVSS